MNFTKLLRQPIIQECDEADGIGALYATFAPDSYIPQHSHSYEHLSFIAYGEGDYWVDAHPPQEPTGHFKGPQFIVIPAHTKHLFLAKTETMLLCIHNTERGGIAIEEEHQIVGDN